MKLGSEMYEFEVVPATTMPKKSPCEEGTAIMLTPVDIEAPPSPPLASEPNETSSTVLVDDDSVPKNEVPCANDREVPPNVDSGGGKKEQTVSKDSGSEKKERSLTRMFCSSLQKEERIIGCFMFFSMCYGLLRTFAPPPVGLYTHYDQCEGGPDAKCVCPRETFCARNAFETFCAFMSKSSAYMDYPLYMFMFLSMSRRSAAALQRSFLSELFHFTRLQHLHRLAGTIVGFEVYWHGFWHLMRWNAQGNLRFAISTRTGLTGVICLCWTPLIVLPMLVGRIRRRLPFELRKGLHYGCYVWASSIIFHAPATNIMWVIGSCFVVYLLDYIYGMFRATYRIPSARFSPVENSVIIRMRKPHGFGDVEGTYCYVCVPWISKAQWHAFSLYADPHDGDCICICATVAGDWTRTLLDSVSRPIDRRCWICGPFPSPFLSGQNKDNLLCVATGVGITPVLNAIQAHAESKAVHLIWMCRDASLIEFVLDFGFAFDDDGCSFIYYTGKRELVFTRTLPGNVFLLQGRPDLDALVSMIMNFSDLETTSSPHEMFGGDALPKGCGDNALQRTPREQFCIEMRRLQMIYSNDQLFSRIIRRSRHVDNRIISFEHLREVVDETFISPLSEDELRTIFDEIDADGNGTVDYQEFIAFLDGVDRGLESTYNISRKSSCENFEVLKEHVSKKLSMTNHSRRRSTADSLWATEPLDDHDPKQQQAPFQNEEETESLVRDEGCTSWKVLYCGENRCVTDTLRRKARESGASFEVESFKW